MVGSRRDDPSSSWARNRRKRQKVSRACDLCKVRKEKCSGTFPCGKCRAKGKTCHYDAVYTRGRPPTPRSSDSGSAIATTTPTRWLESRMNHDCSATELASRIPGQAEDVDAPAVPSRASPELLGMAEIQGQVFDPTSGLSFLHRAWKKLSAHQTATAGRRHNTSTGTSSSSPTDQPWMMAGDLPLPSPPRDIQSWDQDDNGQIPFPAPEEARELLMLYFDVCIATYRFLHRPSVFGWMEQMKANFACRLPPWHGLGKPRTAIVMCALAISTTHKDKSDSEPATASDASSLVRSDKLFAISRHLTDTETGYPGLHSAQARLVQVLYLLTTSRFNQAWYVFGTTLQIVLALGLHRGARKRHGLAEKADYIHVQCGIRTFWTTYILDKYLGVVFGRPRHYHDDDVDQDLPDCVEDEDMMATFGNGMGAKVRTDGRNAALIHHARLGKIIGTTSRRVYSPQSTPSERLAMARLVITELHDWHASLPPHLNSTINSAMLVQPFRRQAVVFKLAYSHAIMHATRLFLIPSRSSAGVGDSGPTSKEASECVSAARAVLETVDGLAQDGPIFHAFWWTHYVTFCALVVTYVWATQGDKREQEDRDEEDQVLLLLALAERCHTHLAHATASNSPSRRYAVILDEFRRAASSRLQKNRSCYSQGQTQGTGAGTRQSRRTAGCGGSDGDGDYSDSLPIHIHNANGEILETERQLGEHDTTVTLQHQQGEESSFQTQTESPSYSATTNEFGEWQTSDWLEIDSSAFWPLMDLTHVPII